MKKKKESKTIDLDRYQDLLLSEQVLKEFYTYGIKVVFDDFKTEKKEKEHRRISVEFKKVDREYVTGWQKGILKFYTQEILGSFLKLVEHHNKLIPHINAPLSDRSSDRGKDFLDWVESNKSLILSKIRTAKRGWKNDLFKLASLQITIPKPTFYRHIKKFEKSVK